MENNTKHDGNTFTKFSIKVGKEEEEEERTRKHGKNRRLTRLYLVFLL